MDTKTAKLNRPRKIEDMSKDQIRQAIIKKRECNAKAQLIVESLLEKCIAENYFIQCLPHINQSHMDDIIEERSIIHLCGYPLCCNSLSKKDIPKQKYRISVKTNKVYDITSRKNFCSNACYKATMYVQRQLLTSPLWFREYEEIPKFQLLKLDSIGSLGQEVDVSLVEKVKLTNHHIFTSINDFANASLQDIPVNNRSDHLNTDEPTTNSNNSKQFNETQGLRNTHTKTVENIGNQQSVKNVHNGKLMKNKQNPKTNEENCDIIILDADQQQKESNKKSELNLNIVGEIVEKSSKEINQLLSDTTVMKPPVQNIDTNKKQKKHCITAVTIAVERCLAEWFTLDTMLFLFGEEKVKEIVADKGDCIREYLNNFSNSIFYNSNTYDQYQELCRKLNLLEMDDKKYDAQVLLRETRPLPDYSILKKETKNMQIKVNAFLGGELEIPNTTSIQSEDNAGENSENTEVGNLTQLPLVDKNAQNALRRRIVCDHLNRMFPDLLRSLGLLTLSITSDVRLLVNTFKLKPNNIMFKPIQWTLIAIVIIKLLSFKDKQLEYFLEQPTAYQHMQLLLLSYKQDGGYLDRLISWLTDIDRLLDSNDTQLTID